MESGGGHKSGGAGPGAGAGAEGGLLCHACGYQYPNAHPSAKQRRAHRKHCGKSEGAGGEPSHERRALFPGEGGGEPAGVGRGGASAAERGGGSPGSAAREAGSAPVDVDKSERSSRDDAEAQVIVDKCVEDHSDVASEITLPETNRTDDSGTLNQVAAVECSRKASLLEEGVPSVPASAVTSVQLQDVSVPVLQPEPGHGEGGISPGLSVSEMPNSSAVSLASDATGGEISERTDDVITEITLPETNRTNDSGTVKQVAAVECSRKASLPEEGVPSVPASAVTSVQLQDVSVPVLQPEPGYGEGGISPELPVSEMPNSNAMSLASDATGGEISERTDDVITESNDTTVTGVNGAANTIGKDTPSEEKSVKGGDLDSSCQEILQTEVGEGHSSTAVEEDSSDKQLSAVRIVDIPNEKPDSNQQSSPILSSTVELVPNIEEPVKSGTQLAVGADDVRSEAADTVKTPEQPDSTSVEEDHLAVPEVTDIFEGEHYLNKDGGTETMSSAVGPAVNAEVISVGGADNMTKNVYSSDVTMGDRIRENVISNTDVPSQANIADLTKSTTGYEINIVNTTNDVEEKGQNEKSAADLTTRDINEVHVTEFVEEKQQDKETIADSISHLTDAVCSTDNYGENEKETIAAASSCNIPSMSSIEEEKQIEEVIANPAPEKTKVTYNREDVEENTQIVVDLKTTEAIVEKDTISEINSCNITDNVEDKKESKEISAGDVSDGTSMICSTANEEKMHNEDLIEDPSSHEKTVVHSTDNVEEKKNEETMVDPNSHSAIDSIEERKNNETSADLSSHGINGAHATEEKDGEPTLESISSKISTVGSVDDAEEKQQNEETTADQISGENITQQGTYVDENGTQNNKDAATVLILDKSEVAEKTSAVEGAEQNKETNAKEISAIQSRDDLEGADQNEEIADKEVIVDSDRSHVSLKVLLADKNVETKEKKPSTKERVLSFRRRSSKDNESPANPGSPTAGSGQQDWNSPARLPVEKKSKGKKQQWVPFICCASMH